MFNSKKFKVFGQEWDIQLHFHWANVPSRNRMIEQCHTNVKQVAMSKYHSIQEAVYWHNATLKNDTSSQTALANAIHLFEVRVKGIDIIHSPNLVTKHGVY